MIDARALNTAMDVVAHMPAGAKRDKALVAAYQVSFLMQSAPKDVVRDALQEAGYL